MGYEFQFRGSIDNIYGFETILGIVYNVKFRPTNYLLGDETTPFADFIFEFIIEVAYNPLVRNPPLDKLVSGTIAAIIKDFYFKKNQTICIYICDSSDGRQELRSRKFHDWFYSHEQCGLVKMDEQIMDSKGNLYPLSVIIRYDHPYFIEILDGFRQIVGQSNSGK
jgi:hypothetical protein